MRTPIKNLAAATMLGLACFALPASAQPQQPDNTGLGLGGGTQDEAPPKVLPRPPIARKADPKPPLLWNFFAFVVIAGAVLGANMIPSKRGHQD